MAAEKASEGRELLCRGQRARGRLAQRVPGAEAARAAQLGESARDVHLKDRFGGSFGVLVVLPNFGA